MAVPKSGRGWKLAPSLIAAEAEADRIAPRRRRTSDGSIGDRAHQARKSDHNPSGGWVHAIDLSHDPKNGFDAHAYARNIAARKDPRVEYIISNKMIASRSRGYRWVKYTGANGHTIHIHISLRHTPQARNDTSSWFNAGILFPTTPIEIPDVPEIPQPEKIITPHDIIEEDDMKIFRDHNGAIWLLGSDASRKHIGSTDEVNALRQALGLDYVDLGPNQPFYNPILSQVVLNYTYAR